ncbi:cupin-like domain-containing protein [Aeoliella sp.]|uniref:cupin-like domain-containing protein n=1 Tax=Aeoliella sp. TaxID=2795800 RepID=UPI003CCC0880
MTQPLLDNWTQQDFDTVEEGVLVARHNLVDTGLFTDDALADIIDTHPAEDLSINTMGVDPNVFDWREGERNGVSGRELVQLVRDGQLWINCRKMLDNNPDYARVFNQLYDEIEAGKPGFQAQQRTANLLISSPTAWVPYHVDMPVNMLWHIRGTKRVWVYPHFDKRFASGEVLEKVCSGEWSEDVPYDPSFDRYALVYDAQPGQLITWPQLAPHRVRNLDGLNVSLSTEHKNPRAKRRINVHTANHLMRTRFGVACKSIDVEGFAAHTKQTLARAFRVAGKFAGKEKEQFVYPKTFVVDPDAPHGYRMKEGVESSVVAPHEELEATGV